jgi:hypothetical protein
MPGPGGVSGHARHMGHATPDTCRARGVCQATPDTCVTPRLTRAGPGRHACHVRPVPPRGSRSGASRRWGRLYRTLPYRGQMDGNTSGGFKFTAREELSRGHSSLMRQKPIRKRSRPSDPSPGSRKRPHSPSPTPPQAGPPAGRRSLLGNPHPPPQGPGVLFAPLTRPRGPTWWPALPTRPRSSRPAERAGRSDGGRPCHQGPGPLQAGAPGVSRRRANPAPFARPGGLRWPAAPGERPDPGHPNAQAVETKWVNGFL